MLHKMGPTCCRRWSTVQKIANSFFYTRMYSEQKEISRQISAALVYDEAATNQILHILNTTSADELARYDVTKARTQKVVKHRLKNGPFKNIQEVLQVEDFGSKILEKLVTSIAAGASKQIPKLEDRFFAKVPSNITTPAVQNKIRKTINTVTSICISSKHVSWAKMEANGHLESWGTHKDFEWPVKDNPMLLHDLALTVRNRLPVSDVYVTEGAATQQHSLTNQQISTVFFNGQRLQFTAMLVTLLATKFPSLNENPEGSSESMKNCFFMHRKTIAQLFDLVVGNETVSAHSLISQIVDNSISQSLGHVLPISIDPLQIDQYEMSDILEKEALSQALLMSAAFIDLAVNCNPLSLKMIAGGKRKGKLGSY